MSELVKFNKIVSGQNIQFTVKVSFVKKCPDYEKLNMWDLNVNYQLESYLHNPVEPAVMNLKTGLGEYYNDGKYIEVGTEEFKRIYHIQTFNNKFSDFLGED